MQLSFSVANKLDSEKEEGGNGGSVLCVVASIDTFNNNTFALPERYALNDSLVDW